MEVDCDYGREEVMTDVDAIPRSGAAEWLI